MNSFPGRSKFWMRLFDAGGPAAVRLSVTLVRLSGLASPMEMPQHPMLSFSTDEELLARLAIRSHIEDVVPELQSGE